MIYIDYNLCLHCGGCIAVCHFDAICFQDPLIIIDHERCTECSSCISVCPVKAIHKKG